MFVNDAKLPGPHDVVEELAVVVAVVVWSVRFRVVRRSDRRHFVPIDRVTTEEKLDFVGNLQIYMYNIHVHV